MKKCLFAITLLVLYLAGVNFAQEKTVEKPYELRGFVRDKNSAVFAGLSLIFNNNRKENIVSTDINGKFSIKLLPGNYELTVNKLISETFKAYINIQEDGLNPNNVEFIIETNPICCGTISEKPYPKITTLPKPGFPAAARAVGARGEVIVGVKIDKEGKVTSAVVESGHPLLRKACEQAAKQTLFESSENIEEREAKLTYVFLFDENEKTNLKHYSNPYRLEIISTVVVIESTTGMLRKKS